MKYLKLILVLLCITSCDYFDKKKVYPEDIIDEELKTFNWNEVDEYPNFSSCNSASTKIEREQCFQYTITKQITSYLNKKVIVVTEEVNDTILIKFLISETGTISIQQLESDSITKIQIPNIDILLENSLANLPKILPAIKRGQQVKTEFKLPVVVKVN